MPIIAENKGGDFVLIPAGNHIARCYGMVQIGTVKEETGIYAGKESHKVRISWETPHECHDFGKGLQPFAIHKEFTLSMNEKATLRKMLESWRGKAFTEEEAERFDITKLLGKPCMINVIHKTSGKGSTYPDISSLATLPKGLECPEQVNQTMELSFDNWKQHIFDSLPDFVKDKIKKSKEYAAMTSPGHSETPQTSNDDDLPF
jgi:hypothetical protein